MSYPSVELETQADRVTQNPGGFLPVGRREWRIHFKKGSGVSVFVWGGVGCWWVVCCFFSSRRRDCGFVVRVLSLASALASAIAA